MGTRKTVALALGALVVLGGCGAPRAATTAADANGPSGQDRTWVARTHQGNMAEIAVGQMAKARGATRDIRSIGGMLVSDHTGADTLLSRAAGRAGMGLPLAPDAAQRRTAQKLAGTSGRAFDRDFVRTQIAAHRTAIAAATAETRDGRTVELRTLAQKTLPTLKKHLWMLQKADT